MSELITSSLLGDEPELLGITGDDGTTAALLCTTLDQLTQSVYLYRPVFDGDRIVDLEVVYCNPAAMLMPLSGGVVPGTFASDVFVEVDTALDAATTAWAGGTPDRYSVLRHGVVDGTIRTIRFEVSTGRAGDLLVQTSHDHSVDDRLAQSEARLLTIVDSLEEAVVLLEPRFGDDLSLVGVQAVYANGRARELGALRLPGLGSLVAPSIGMVRAAWTSDRPVATMVDNLGGHDPDLPEIALDLRLSRVGNLLVHVAQDHTEHRRAVLAETEANRRFAATVEVLGEAVGVFDPVLDEHGDLVDFVLVDANATMLRYLPIGGRVSTVPTLSGDPVQWGTDAILQPGAPVRRTLTLASEVVGGSRDMTLRVSMVASGGQVLMVSADITALNAALARVTASDHMLRAVLESLTETVRVFDADGSIIYANANSILPHIERGDGPGRSSIEICRPDGTPLDPADWPLERGRRGERVDDLVVGVRADEEYRVCRVAVRPISDDEGELPHAIVLSAHDITDSVRHADQLAWLSTHSPLTELPNRLGLVDALRDMEAQHGRRVAIAWVRLSALDTISPTFGFDTGDAAICAAARRAASIAERFDGVAAHPSEHDLVVVAPGDDDVALRLGRALDDALSEPLEASGVALLLEPLVGLSIAPRHGTDPNELLQRAQTASWAADRHHSTHERWRVDLGVEQMRRVELLGDVRRAMSVGELFLRYQPKYDLRSGELVGAEALARWFRHGDETIRPDEFIPAVEASGLARPFTAWAIRRAVEEWQPVLRIAPRSKVAVNVPGQVLVDPAFVETVEAELAELDASPSCLVLEITERSVAADVDAIAEAIDRFAQLGVGISIDDFGTGQSSLAYLRRLRPAEIKIDRTFVAGAATGEDPVARSVLQACVDIGRSAGYAVCGEGVETDAELELLTVLGCDTAQGHLLGRPGPIDPLLTTPPGH